MRSASGLAECEPWPEAGLATCSETEAHFPGEAGCAPIGDPCPVDGFPAGLPAGEPVLYVREGATGGDGTRALPFATLAEALAMAAPGTTIAIARGRYDAGFTITEPVTLWGACMDTRLTANPMTIALLLRNAAITVRNLRISSSVTAISSFDADVTLRDVVVDDVTGTAISVSRGRVDGRNIVVRDASLVAVSLLGGALGSLERVSFVRNRSAVIEVSNASLIVRAVAILDSGMDVLDPVLMLVSGTSGSLRLEQAAIERNRTARVVALGGATAALVDTVLSFPAGESGIGEPGPIAIEGSSIVLERVRLERVPFGSVGVIDPGSSLLARDVVVRDTERGSDPNGGHGIEVVDGATGTLERVLIERARGVGLLASGADVAVSDLTVTGTLADGLGTFGRAVEVQLGATIDGMRVNLSNNREATFVAAGADTMVTLVDLVVEDTAERGCASVGCPGAGVGLGSYLDAIVSVERFRIERNALAGAQLARGGEIDLHDGSIADNPVGVNVQVPGYDLRRLSAGVLFRGNGVNLDADTLPTPDPTAP